MGNCCTKCFNEYAIQKFIEDNGSIGDCNYCDSKGIITVHIGILGEYVRERFTCVYDNVDNYGTYWNPDTAEYLIGESAIDILYKELNFSDAVDMSGEFEHLVADILEDSKPTPSEIKRNDADNLMGNGGYYIEKSEYYPEDNRFARSWDAFKFLVKHHSRFFDVEGDWSRESLLEDLFEQYTMQHCVLLKGEKIWRARVADEDLPINPMDIQNSLGPPPRTSSKHSRMSPAGIPYFYTSRELETCLAEIKPCIGTTVWAGKFMVEKDMTLFDLSVIPKTEIPSIFDPLYDSDLAWATKFFKDFNNEISAPIDGDKNYLDYVPIQILAEYIRIQGFDGIKFTSSQNTSGINFTLFCQPNDSMNNFRDFNFDSLEPFTEFVILTEFKEICISSVKIDFEHLESRKFDKSNFEKSNPQDMQKNLFLDL